MATIKEIAKQAGVSVAAVSAALSGRNGTIGVAEKTRLRILRVAEESGYRPNPLAASLRTRRTGNIGICLREPEAYLAHPHGARNFWTMCDLAARHGYQLNLSIADRCELDSRTMDGCLVLNDPVEECLEATLKRLARDIPVICLYRKYPWSVPVIENTSWHSERRRAAEYLYGMGHRSIVVTHLDRPSQKAIPQMFLKVAEERGLNVTIQSVEQTSMDRCYRSIKKVLALDPLPSAVFAIDDDYARVLISQLQRRGLRVPEQVSVFSGSTMPCPNTMWPGLTGLHIRFEREWEGLIDAFVKRIKGDHGPEPIQLDALDVELIERESCAAPPLGAS